MRVGEWPSQDIAPASYHFLKWEYILKNGSEPDTVGSNPTSPAMRKGIKYIALDFF
jgi:hypothetical protein